MGTSIDNEMDYALVSQHFKGKRILITGNSGFKGSWLSLMLHSMGAKVYGLSNTAYMQEREVSAITTGSYVEHSVTNIQDYEGVKAIIANARPHYIFHLAANALTLASYENPLETYRTNAMGTAHVLEAARRLEKECRIIVVSSDKCYENKGWVWGYRETDTLAGMDPYSASKSLAELITHSYFRSFFSSPDSLIRVASCRAGNVVGGGDWSMNRIVPDCIKLWKAKKPLIIRNPEHIRPWNYVLDVLWGYILTAYHLDRGLINGEAFNFGPNINQGVEVEKLVKILWEFWPDKSFQPYTISIEQSSEKREHEILKLNSDKAFSLLRWSPKMSITKGLSETIAWYINADSHISDPDSLSLSFIENYINYLND